MTDILECALYFGQGLSDYLTCSLVSDGSSGIVAPVLRKKIYVMGTH